MQTPATRRSVLHRLAPRRPSLSLSAAVGSGACVLAMALAAWWSMTRPEGVPAQVQAIDRWAGVEADYALGPNPTVSLLPDGLAVGVGGGLLDGGRAVEAFDPASLTWAHAANLGIERMMHTSSVLPDGRVLVLGGWTFADFGLTPPPTATAATPDTSRRVTDTAMAELVDVGRRTVDVQGKLLGGHRFGHVALTLHDGRILVAGGCRTLDDCPLQAVIYDPATAKWSSAGTLSAPRFTPAGVVLADGRALVVGGGRSATNDYDLMRGQPSADIYDPAARMWRSVSAPNHPHAYGAATLLADGRVLLVACEVPQAEKSKMVPAIEIYDPQADSWTDAAPFPPPLNLEPVAVTLVSGRVLVVPGTMTTLSDPDPKLRLARLYDPLADAWTTAPARDMPIMGLGFRPAAIRLLDGRVLVTEGSHANLFIEAGPEPGSTPATTPSAGNSPTSTPSPSVTLSVTCTLTPTTAPPPTDTRVPTVTPTSTPPAYGSWSSTGPMLYPRLEHSAIALRDGRVLVAGGHGPGSRFVKTAEIYDPATNDWSEAGEMNSARIWHTSLLMADDRVLVIGGVDMTRGSHVAPVWPPPEVFDPASTTWSVLSTDIQADYGSCQVLLPDGRVLLSGFVEPGYCDHLGHAIRKTVLLDPTTGRSTPGPDMRDRRTKEWSAELADGTVLLGGGTETAVVPDWPECDVYGTPKRSVEAFDPTTGAFRELAALPLDPVDSVWRIPNGNSNHQLRLQDGRILVTNGLESTPLVYSLAEDAWWTISWGSVKRTNPLAALLPNGMVLLVSGGGADSPTGRSAELYDPAAGAWLWAGEARRPYGSLVATATTLPDGRVLVVGSSSLEGDTGAELYEFSEPFRGRVYIPITCTD
jgi:hypothetical protein